MKKHRGKIILLAVFLVALCLGGIIYRQYRINSQFHREVVIVQAAYANDVINNRHISDDQIPAEYATTRKSKAIYRSYISFLGTEKLARKSLTKHPNISDRYKAPVERIANINRKLAEIYAEALMRNPENPDLTEAEKNLLRSLGPEQLDIMTMLADGYLYTKFKQFFFDEEDE
ncbi:hypothetical protein [Poriferisphaera sp. WC338]|uniref:hypothetical protein n=1 Tax=Poriferisphaera sp. WC338 TaxID=3425129 RepID=UPI003D817A38